jgi:type I restriction enzyme M protein
MLTGEIRSQIDQIWNAFWSGGISNPLEVIEQITYLLFLKRLDEQEIAEELKANREKKPMQKRFFPEGKDSKKRSFQDYRWNRFKNTDPRDMYAVVSEHVFPWLRTLGGNGTTYSKHMEGARFTIPTPALLAKVVDMIDKVPMEDRDTKGDLYEYMLGKIASAGQNGQFRTPRHIIRLMVEMVEPKPTDIVCDPACGTCGFLVAVGESLRERHPEVMTNAKLRQHFHRDLFHGFDFDNTMLRIGSMNMLLHGVENPDVVIAIRSRKIMRARMKNIRWCWRIRRSPGRSTTRAAPRTCSRSSRPRRPNCFSWRCFCGCSSRADEPPSSCRTAFSSDQAMRTRACARCSSRIRSSTP